MDELHDIFMKEIKQTKQLALPQSQKEIVPSHQNGTSNSVSEQAQGNILIEEKAETKKTSTPKSSNLLLNIVNQ